MKGRLVVTDFEQFVIPTEQFHSENEVATRNLIIVMSSDSCRLSPSVSHKTLEEKKEEHEESWLKLEFGAWNLLRIN